MQTKKALVWVEECGCGTTALVYFFEKNGKIRINIEYRGKAIPCTDMVFGMRKTYLRSGTDTQAQKLEGAVVGEHIHPGVALSGLRLAMQSLKSSSGAVYKWTRELGDTEKNLESLEAMMDILERLHQGRCSVKGCE